MDAITEPVPRPLERLLRRAVADHAAVEHRKAFAPTVHVGVPGLVDAPFELGAVLGASGLDQALRVDVVEALVTRARRLQTPEHRRGPLLTWLVRRGPLEPQDVDLAWLTATRAAALELGERLPFVVVNRQGWRDVVSGVGRTWERVRDRAQP